MTVFPLSSPIFVWASPICFAVTKFPSATLIYLSVATNNPGIKSEIYGVVWQVAPESKIQLGSCKLFKISFRYFCIWRHTCHIHVYLLGLNFICTVFRRLIYFCWYVYTSFRVLRAPVNFLIREVRFWTTCNSMILQYTYEARIWFPTVMFITLNIRVVYIKWLFLISVFLSLLLQLFFGWSWTSTVNAPLLSINSSLIIYIWFTNWLFEFGQFSKK